MAITNHERVGTAMELLRAGLRPFVARETNSAYKGRAKAEVHRVTGIQIEPKKGLVELDVAALLKFMWDAWNEVFRATLGPAERSIVSELRGVRNRWAHQEPFSTDDAYRALDSAHRLLTAMSAPESGEIEKMKEQLLRLRYDEQVRTERRRGAGTPIEGQVSGNLAPWREVISPHGDVASGRFQQAEFAADLWQVHMGEGGDEYRMPVEFFRRTYLTGGLKRLLVGAVRRLSGTSGDPVVQLQTNFGGGKTHSMLALYHLLSGVDPAGLEGIDGVLAEAEVTSLPAVNRVVLVGNKISPGNPVTKDDGTVVRTLWGELAWQLGGREAYERVRADDEKATNPGDVLRELMNKHAPCLILIDEWVAYARQLHEESDLPAGSFETHFTFAQALTEAARASDRCLLVVSLPASDTSGSPHSPADDVEVGGERGRQALDRLRNVVGRIEASWRPASAEEGFEIVRRRLFEPIVEQKHFVARDTVARTFYDLYRTQHQEFPPDSREADYEKRIVAAYPIHPEVFDRLYTDWSTLVKFQRTRGVLRLMATVIHSLWTAQDRNPLIMPANIPIDDPRVQEELTRYLSDNWVPIIERDVDGPNSLPMRIDGEVPNLGKFAATRRVARAIYLGSAPITTAANRGIEDRRVKLGCVMPGESPAIFGDALRRLGASATYLYQDGTRFWYSTQPTVTKLADDRTETLVRNPEKVAQEIEKRLRADLTNRGDFARVHPLPTSSQDVQDDMEARLVVLGVDAPYSKEAGNPAVVAAKRILETRGSSPRLFQNTLVFLAVDGTRLHDLDEAVRRHLAWESILADKETLDLTVLQIRQAEAQKASADTTVTARLPEAYQWLLVPAQSTPQSEVEWQAVRLSGQDSLSARASKRLRNDESLITNLGPARLRMELDRVPLWREDNVQITQLVEDFAKYLYLPRLKDPSVLVETMRAGLALMTWEQDSFAYAESYDEDQGRYRGLRHMEQVQVSESGPGMLVRPEVARKQIDAETKPVIDPPPGPIEPPPGPIVPPSPVPPKARRFHGSVSLDPTRAGRDASVIADEVIAHLSALVGANVKVTLDIEADVPDGVPEQIVRIVTENSQTLKFKSHGFEKE